MNDVYARLVLSVAMSRRLGINMDNPSYTWHRTMSTEHWRIYAIARCGGQHNER